MDSNVSGSQPVQRSTPPQVGIPTPPPPATPTPKRRFSKKLLIILLLIIIIITSVVIFLLLPENSPIKTVLKQQKDNASELTQNPNQPLEGLLQTEENIKFVSSETADYIESQRNPDGSYNFFAHPEENCELINGIEECPFGGEKTDMRVNGWTSLGNFAAFKTTENEKYRSRMERDLQTLYTWCDTQPPGECLWVLTQLEIIYKDTKDPLLLDFLSKQLELLLNSTPSTDIMLRSIEARELALGYEIFNDVRYLNAASIRSSSARSEVQSSENNIYPTISPYPKLPIYACWYYLADAEIARVTIDEELSRKTLNELNQAKIFTNFSYFSYPGAIQPCIEAYHILGEALHIENANNDYTALVDTFMNSFYDNPKNKIIYGEGGTVFYPRNISKNFGKKYVLTSDTSYTLYLLKLMP